ncbi:hypothetical protein [Roseovarius sp.]|uniref:hypothetical protein n=1 Tax=Roseovarius sp. TaxID=1486281 RepID=UPI003BA97F1A
MMPPKGLNAATDAGQKPPRQKRPGMPRQKGLEGPEPRDAPGAENMPTPETKEAYNKLYAYSLLHLYNKEFMPKAVESIKKAPTPEAGIAGIASSIGAKLYFSAQKAGERIPDEAMLMAGWQVVNEIAKFAEIKAEVGKLSEEQIEDAFLIAADELQAKLGPDSTLGDGVTPEEVQAMAEKAGGEEGIRALEQRKMAKMMPQDMRQQMQGTGADAPIPRQPKGAMS